MFKLTYDEIVERYVQNFIEDDNEGFHCVIYNPLEQGLANGMAVNNVFNLAVLSHAVYFDKEQVVIFRITNYAKFTNDNYHVAKAIFNKFREIGVDIDFYHMRKKLDLTFKPVQKTILVAHHTMPASGSYGINFTSPNTVIRVLVNKKLRYTYETANMFAFTYEAAKGDSIEVISTYMLNSPEEVEADKHNLQYLKLSDLDKGVPCTI